MQAFLAYLLGLLLAARPSGHALDLGCAEPTDVYAARVALHIDAAAAQVYSIDAPPLVTGPWAREQSLVHVLAVAHHESYGWCRAVVLGQRRGDHGASGCAMGLMSDHGRVESWSLQDVIDEPALCYSIGYRRMRMSFRLCNSPTNRLAAYASGSCSLGTRESRDMMVTAWRWWGKVHAAWQAGEWSVPE